MVDLSVSIGNLRLSNPLILASGIFSQKLIQDLSFERSQTVFDSLGAFITKTLWSEVREGNPEPRTSELKTTSYHRVKDDLVPYEVPIGMLNSVGLPSRGVEYFLRQDLPCYRRFCSELIVSVSAPSRERFVRLVQLLESYRSSGIKAFEVNISCPNLERPGENFATSPRATASIVQSLRKITSLPLWVKLSPNTQNITTIAKAAENAGADAIVVANTLLAMAIDVNSFRSRLGTLIGGLSGAAVKPIILRLVYRCTQVVDIPVIGCGGIMSAEDVIEYLLVGAKAVQLGTAIYHDPLLPIKIRTDLQQFCTKNKVHKLSDIIGALH